MPGQSPNNSGSDRSMKNSGSSPQALRSYPQHLTSQATESQDPGVQLGLFLPQEGGVKETQMMPDHQKKWVWCQLSFQTGGKQRPIAEVAELQPAPSLS